MATETNTPAKSKIPGGSGDPQQAGRAVVEHRPPQWPLVWIPVPALGAHLELKREPEVVFWVFIFPLLLAAGLGIAFRNKPADITSVVVIDGAGAQKTLAMLQNLAGR